MMMLCKRLAQVPMLCVPIYNMKLAMMQKKLTFFTTFSAHTKMAANKRGQIEVFARSATTAASTTTHTTTPSTSTSTNTATKSTSSSSSSSSSSRTSSRK